MIVVGLCGLAQSGKDTAAGALIEDGFIRLAFADALRDAVYALDPIVGSDGVGARSVVDALGWDLAKTSFPEVRRVLQRFGTEVGRDQFGEGFWVERLRAQMSGSALGYVITDCRFVNEERFVHSLGGVMVRVVRPGVSLLNDHSSEAHISGLVVDAEIVNDGSVAGLHGAIRSLVWGI